MENNQRNSRKRLNSLILLVAFTAVMLIVSTYAWFSTQKNVTLDGLKGVVNVAEGLQMSLDAKHWVNTIDFDDFVQTSASSWTVSPTSTSTYLDAGKTFQSPVGDEDKIKNVVPTELLPVSTTAYSSTNDGIGQEDVVFYDGTNTETIKLMGDIGTVTENADAGYFAFDLFLMNTSAGNDNDVLQLDPVSDVKGGNESTGVQNTARVAFALYENVNDSEVSGEYVSFKGTDGEAGTADDVGGTGKDMTIHGNNTLSQDQIIAGTSTGRKIADVAIWEPNANAHAAAIVSSLANSLKLESEEHALWTGLGEQNASTGISTFADGIKIPTYALTSASIVGATGNEKDVHIADVYDWRTTTASVTTDALGVKKQFTLQTDAYDDTSAGSLRAESEDLVSTGKLEADADATDTTFEIKPNQYQKIRVYVWMEGQDPDCINSASLGGGLTIDIGFSKPGTENSSEVSGS